MYTIGTKTFTCVYKVKNPYNFDLISCCPIESGQKVNNSNFPYIFDIKLYCSQNIILKLNDVRF